MFGCEFVLTHDDDSYYDNTFVITLLLCISTSCLLYLSWLLSLAMAFVLCHFLSCGREFADEKYYGLVPRLSPRPDEKCFIFSLG